MWATHRPLALLRPAVHPSSPSDHATCMSLESPTEIDQRRKMLPSGGLPVSTVAWELVIYVGQEGAPLLPR